MKQRKMSDFSFKIFSVELELESFPVPLSQFLNTWKLWNRQILNLSSGRTFIDFFNNFLTFSKAFPALPPSSQWPVPSSFQSTKESKNKLILSLASSHQPSLDQHSLLWLIISCIGTLTLPKLSRRLWKTSL